MPSLYKNWNESMQSFCRVGGIIEAAPTCKAEFLKIGKNKY